MRSSLSFHYSRRSTLFWIGSIVVVALLAVNNFCADPVSLTHAAASVPRAGYGFKLRRLRMRLVLDQSYGVSASEPISNASTRHLSEIIAKPSLVDYTQENCLAFDNAYTQVLSHNLEGQVQQAICDNHTSLSSLYVSDGRILLDQYADRRAMQPLFALLKHLMNKVSLPNLILPASLSITRSTSNSSAADAAGPCKQRQTGSLFPDLRFRNASANGSHMGANSTIVRQAPYLPACPDIVGAPPCDKSLLNSTDQLRSGCEHESLLLLESGVWSGRMANQSFLKLDTNNSKQQASCHNTSWAPSNGIRLAEQLASNALVFMHEGRKPQWYSYLLKPFIHFVPVRVNSTHNNLSEMLAWAAEHKYAASLISRQAKEFTHLYFSSMGTECYTLQTLSKLGDSGKKFSVPASAEDVSACHDLNCCAI